jgi:rRNA biogenesis protein RRP5
MAPLKPVGIIRRTRSEWSISTIRYLYVPGHLRRHVNIRSQRVTVGMKIFGQIVSIQPLALVISLPNQLLGHVPVTQISTQFTALLDAAENDEEILVSDEAEDDDAGIRPSIPALSDIFHVGQYLRTVVTAVRESRSTELTAIGRTRDEVVRASKRVELSLVPESVNDGVHKSDIRAGFVSTALPSVLFPDLTSC